MFGAWIEVRTILVPLFLKIAWNRAENSESKSTIKYRFPSLPQIPSFLVLLQLA
jgi:hypothetical protein